MGKYLVQEIRVNRRSSAPTWDLRKCEITSYRDCFHYGEADSIEEAREIMIKGFKKEWQIDQYLHIWQISEITERDEDGDPVWWVTIETRDLWREREALGNAEMA